MRHSNPSPTVSSKALGFGASLSSLTASMGSGSSYTSKCGPNDSTQKPSVWFAPFAGGPDDRIHGTATTHRTAELVVTWVRKAASEQIILAITR